MSIAPQSLEDALSTFDRAAAAEHAKQAEAERSAVLELFPREAWPDLPLERYALGTGDENAFCRWLEYKTPHLGLMGGSPARKFLVYKRATADDWYFDDQYPNERAAWEAVRGAFLDAFQLADDGDWDAIDELEPLYGGPMLRVKALRLYFPDELLGVNSTGHLRHFLERLGVPVANAESQKSVRLNRRLLETLRNDSRLAGLSNAELGNLLYHWADPREARRIVKIAPGERAKFWDDCVANSYACMGWEEVGDLTRFETKEEFVAAFDEVFAEKHAKKGTRRRKANELWTLRELEPGDVVLANRGTSHVLALGEVVEPGYEFRPDREVYQHTVHVDWDTSVAADIPEQKAWAFNTVGKVPYEIYERVATGKTPNGGGVRTPRVHVPPLFREIAEALERKGQLVLYGPPGTGKTYTARRFAVWWLRQHAGIAQPAAPLGDPAAFLAEEDRLSASRTTARTWWMVANPANWAWSQLFDDGRVDYSRGRLTRNFDRVQPGDLVVGYQSTPDKRVVALARVTRGLHPTDDGPKVDLVPIAPVANGPTFDELVADEALADSEPIRNRCQGTLFALDDAEAEHVLSLLAERDPSLGEHLGPEDGVARLTKLTFHPSYGYEDFVEGFRPMASASGEGLQLRLEDGVFKRICREANARPDERFLVLIDEVNRANVAKVFGELITLLENTKRGMVVMLPQSRDPFVIPPNVFLLATMNTADRSIKLLDAALRRRFAFHELMPDPELLTGTRIGRLHLDEFLAALNARVSARVGRERQIGHSFLMRDGTPVEEPADFARCFRQEILPLLQEHAYEDFATLAGLLGRGVVDVDERRVKDDVVADPEELLTALEREFAGADDPDEVA